MPPKSFKPVPLTQEAETKKLDHSDPTPKLFGSTFGEQGSVNASCNYGGSRRTLNATVNAPELQAGIAKQKAQVVARIKEHAEYKRVKRGRRSLTHRLPLEESYKEDGTVTLTRSVTTTHRTEH